MSSILQFIGACLLVVQGLSLPSLTEAIAGVGAARAKPVIHHHNATRDHPVHTMHNDTHASEDEGWGHDSEDEDWGSNSEDDDWEYDSEDEF